MYISLAHFLGEMLKDLPFNNEVGSTKPLRRDALVGKRFWTDITDIFVINDTSEQEIFKNEVYSSHQIPSAICYNIDLSTRQNPAENGLVIQRLHMINSGEEMTGEYDAEFDINPFRIIIDPFRYKLYNVHKE